MRREYQCKCNEKGNWKYGYFWATSLKDATEHFNERFGADNIGRIRDISGMIGLSVG